MAFIPQEVPKNAFPDKVPRDTPKKAMDRGPLVSARMAQMVGRTSSAIAALNLAGSSANGSCPDASNHTSLFDGAVSDSK